MSSRTSSLAALLLLPACAAEGFGATSRLAPGLPIAVAAAGNGSLFSPAGYVGLASDRRARHVGDLVTVRLVERTRAAKRASAKSSRDSDSDIRLPEALPFDRVPAGLLQGGSSQSFSGSGSAEQDNQLAGEITVTVMQVLPGGVLLVAGEKRLTLNRGEEQVQLTGRIRVDDLGADNSVVSTRVADARIRYVGTGQVADQSRQGWLARFFAKVTPL